MNESKIDNNTNLEIKELFSTVVDGGYCIGCGACASLPDSPITMKMDPFNIMQATVDVSNIRNDDNLYTKVCPFSNNSLNEDEIGKSLFPVNTKKDDKLGYVVQNYAGFVAENDYREKGSSGGMGTWIVAELLKRKLIDYVVHIHQRAPDEEDSRLFAYTVSSNMEEVRKGAKSRYYPIELAEVMNVVKAVPGKYAIVGVPCFIKSIRLLTYQDADFKSRVSYCIGLVCGHLKSGSFAEMFGWQIGINPKNLTAIDFRTKLEGHGANKYGVTVTETINGVSSDKVSKPVSELYGTNWGLGFFRYKACDFCDDVVAETADITVGDAWLPEFVNETKGTNIIVVRNSEINDIILEAIKENRLSLTVLDNAKVIESQSSGFNHRREGLSYRLHLTDLEGKWRPFKRVRPKANWPKRFKAIHKTRILLAAESHLAFQKAKEKDSFDVFKDRMDPIIADYRKLYKYSLIQRIFRKGGSLLKKFFNKSAL
jgi:coenzyme F420 hydrogenase subunit beta